MEITVSRMTLSLAVLVAVLCVADAQSLNHRVRRAPSYLAFPRMGRGSSFNKKYIAFPRMGGRSGVKAETTDSGSCCGIGIKDEFVVGSDGKESLSSICPAVNQCCEGLREIIAEKPNGSLYTFCIPEYHASGASSLNKLKDLLRK